jgi:hypothetical protein
VENFTPCLWKKLWKTLQASLCLYLNILDILKIGFPACAKLEKMPRKKIFFTEKREFIHKIAADLTVSSIGVSVFIKLRSKKLPP